MFSGSDGAGIIDYGERSVENSFYHISEEFYTKNADSALAASLAALARMGAARG